MTITGLIVLSIAMLLMAVNMIVITVYQRCGGAVEQRDVTIVQLTTFACWLALLALVFFTMAAPWLDDQQSSIRNRQTAVTTEYFTVSIYNKSGELIQQYPGCDSIHVDNNAVSFVYDNETGSLTINNNEYIIVVDDDEHPAKT